MFKIKQTKKNRRYREIKYSIISYGLVALIFVFLLVISIEAIHEYTNGDSDNTNDVNLNQSNARHLLSNMDEPYKIEGADYPVDLFTKV